MTASTTKAKEPTMSHPSPSIGRFAPRHFGRALASGLVLALLARALADVGDGGDEALAQRAVPALDRGQPDRGGQAGVSLFDSDESHDVLLDGW